MLKLLNQDLFFDSLNWFKSINFSLVCDLKLVNDRLKEVQRSKIRDESLIQTLFIKEKHIKELLLNYQYLSQTFSVALLFFYSKEKNHQTNIIYDSDEEVFLEDF